MVSILACNISQKGNLLVDHIHISTENNGSSMDFIIGRDLYQVVCRFCVAV